ncbi:MAG TPA: hypothetical protein VGI50_14525 [Solirubrobacteraceae bacterium]
MRKRSLVCALSVATGFSVAPAVASAADPGFDFAPRPSCVGAAPCLTQAVTFLDRARAKLGQPPYELPGNFASLDPARQALVLTDLDRVMYGLRPIAGLASDLDQAAAAGVRSGNDPLAPPTDYLTLTSNWAGGYLNMAFAYEAWMYDDGPGSNNFDCTLLNRSGCWDHRNNILWQFGGRGPLAMGAAAGPGPGGTLGFTVLLVQGAPGYTPVYTYTWNEAVAAGAGRPAVQWHPARRGRLSCARTHTTRHRRRRRSARCASR